MAETAHPNYRRPELEAVEPDLTLVADLLGGTRAMHARSKEYVRKWHDEQPAVYEIRRQCETVFEGLGRTISAATGMLFAKAPAMVWNQSEAAMSPHWDNIDGEGTKGSVLIKRFAESALADGVGVILVDHTPQPKDVVVHGGNDSALGLRPLWAVYSRAQVINWRTTIVNGNRVLTMLVLHECAEVADGEYGISAVNRYRVLRLVNNVASWQLLEERKDATGNVTFVDIGSGQFVNKNGKVADFIPASIAYTGKKVATMVATIPLMGVAWANKSHWLKSTDIEFYEQCCAFPQPTITGTLAPDAQTGTPGKLKIGPMVAVHLSEADAKFLWTELTGTSLEQLKQSREEKLGQMAKLGMAFLVTDTRAAETAAAKQLDATAENSTLATAAQGIEDAANAALEFHAWYLGIEKAGAPVLSINRDFESTVMDAPVMLAYVAAFRDAGFPIRLLLEAWKTGGRIAQDADLDKLELEMQAAAIAKEEQARQAAADALAMKQQPPVQKVAA